MTQRYGKVSTAFHRKPGELCVTKPRYAYSEFSGVMSEPHTEYGRMSYVTCIPRGTTMLVVASVDHGWGEDILALLPGDVVGWLFGDDVSPA